MLSTTRRAALATAALMLALLAGCSSASNDSADVPAGADSAEVPGTAGSGAQGMADRDSAAGDDAAEGEAVADGEIAESDGAAVEPVVQNLPEGRMIARDAQLGFAVEDVNEAAAQVRAAATAADGWVVSEEVQPDAGRDVFEGFAMIVVSVPSAQLDATLEKLGPTGRLTSRNITSLDVTQDFKDSNVRIATLEASITRVRGLLADATDIEDIVFLERELASREAELDVLKAHVMGLEADVERSTITVQLSETDPAEPVTVVEEDEPIGFAAGLAAGWRAFLGGVAFLLTAFGALLPFAIVAAIVLLPVLWWRRRRTQFGRPARPSVTTAE